MTLVDSNWRAWRELAVYGTAWDPNADDWRPLSFELKRWDLKISESLVAAIAGSDSVRVSRAGHFCMVENPSEFNGRLLEFLATHG